MNNFISIMIMKILLFFSFFINFYCCFSQQQFKYNFYIDNTVREGILFYSTTKNTSVYLDKIGTTRIVDKGKDDEVGNIQASFNSNADLHFFKNNNEVLFTYNLLKVNYLVDDKLPKIEWMLSSEKKEIQNLICYKATSTFRGRNWTVWYCPEIPVSYGPWKFYNLPGLLVEAKEDTNRFAFTLTNYILNTNNKVPEINMEKHRKVTMKKMAEVTDEAFENLLNTLSKKKTDGVEVELVQEKSNTGKGQSIEVYYEWEEQPKN